MGRWDVKFEDGLAYYDNAVDEAEQEILDMGLLMGERPTDTRGELTDRPHMPADLSECSWKYLQKLIGQFTGWYDYAIGQYKLAIARRNVGDKKKTYSWSRIRKSKEGTVADKNDDTTVDSRYMQQDAHYEYCDTKSRLLEGIVDGLKRDIETVSRSMTALEGRQGVEGRAAGIGRRTPRNPDPGRPQQMTMRTPRPDVLGKFRKRNR